MIYDMSFDSNVNVMRYVDLCQPECLFGGISLSQIIELRLHRQHLIIALSVPEW